MGMLRDHCGVIAVAAKEEVASSLFFGLKSLQHRGQESAGITTLAADGQARTIKGMGLVDNVFPPEKVAELRGQYGIGHVRYSTAGRSVVENAQPHSVQSQFGWVALAHNGDIVNAPALLEGLKAKGWAFITDSDTEVATRLLAKKLTDNGGNAMRAIRDLMGELSGSYSFTMVVGSDLYAVRDPFGIRPLCIGKLPNDGGYMAASESVALDVLGAEYIRDVAPGEIVRITRDGYEAQQTPAAPHPAHCFFEYVYFARSDSVIDGQLAHEARRKIGMALAKEAPVEADIVVPVPDSGRAHASGYAEASGLPLREGLMKNRYVHRTFIMPGQDNRERNVRLKLNPVKPMIQGKRVVVVDDSIVRSTTMRRIVELLRQAGAAQVHVRIASPPITDPCYLGVDFHHRDQLVAANHKVEEIRKLIGSDSLAYVSIGGLVQAIGMPKSSMCLGCVTGEYPIAIEGERVRGQHVLEDFPVST
ncbi:MAG: amidophosphoribosyltransferase [Euryarchaeota archaeon]|nr:amidophosphoribosyltransferase [Euryarchaeota archaeon]